MSDESDITKEKNSEDEESQTCREALAKAVKPEQWVELLSKLLDLAEGAKSEPARVRATELLLRYHYGGPTPPPPAKEEIEPITIIDIRRAKDRPPDK